MAPKANRAKQTGVISPLAFEAVRRIDGVFEIERAINGAGADDRLAVRTEQSAPLVAELETWMRAERAGLSRHAPVAKAMDYMLNRVAELKPDVLVAEAGASPLEPYNGAAALDELGSNIVCRILSANDPYAVLGVQSAFDFMPDLVTGPATNTSAGIDLVRLLTGVEGYIESCAMGLLAALFTEAQLRGRRIEPPPATTASPSW